MITTLSGTYTVQQYKRISNKMKRAFKQYWAGKITGAKLETIKDTIGLSYAEIRDCQYIASREVERGK